jgi:hypothetical protein
MGIGAGTGLLAAGAILYWAVDVDLPYLDDNALGAILIAAGVLAITVGVLMNARRTSGPNDVASGLGLLATGAILVWGLDVDLPFIYDEALGAILMVGGLVTIAAALFMHVQASRSTHVVQRRY